MLDFSSDAVDSIWSLVAAILHLGNLDFESDGDGERVRVADRAGLARVAALLDVTTKELQEALCTRVIAANGQVRDTRDFMSTRFYFVSSRSRNPINCS